MKRTILTCIFIFCFVLISFNQQIVYVRADGNGDGSSWENATNDIQYAIYSIITDEGEIWIAEGIYYPPYRQDFWGEYTSFNLKSNLKLFGGFPTVGDPQFDERDALKYRTILSGDTARDDVQKPIVADILNESNMNNNLETIVESYLDTAVVIDGFIFTAAKNDGLVNSQCKLEVKNCIFTGIGLYSMSTPIENFKSSNVFIDCIFENCGGRVISDYESNSVFRNCNVQNNNASHCCYTYQSKVTFINGSFFGNTSESDGTAIYLQENSEFYLLNTKLAGNMTEGGGTIYNESSDITVINCLISGNSADGSSFRTYGGGIYNYSGNLTLINTTITGNYADEAGAIYNKKGDVDISNSIIWGNCNGIISDGEITFSNSIIEGDFTGENVFNEDPGFLQPISCTFAPTLDGNYHLSSASPALNAGSEELITEDLWDIDQDGNVEEKVDRDLDSNIRILENKIDLGAYEGGQEIEYKRVYVKENASGEGTSWEDAIGTIYEALEIPFANEIWVAEGVYYATENDRNESLILRKNISLVGGFPNTGQPELSDRSPIEHPTIISGDFNKNDNQSPIIEDINNAQGNDDNSFHVIMASGCDTSTIVDGFIITAGYAHPGDDGDDKQKHGGGIFMFKGGIKLLNCQVVGNSCDTYGGGLYIDEGSFYIKDCIFKNNYAYSLGGAFFDGTEGNKNDIVSTEFISNKAENGGGGTILLER